MKCEIKAGLQPLRYIAFHYFAKKKGLPTRAFDGAKSERNHSIFLRTHYQLFAQKIVLNSIAYSFIVWHSGSSLRPINFQFKTNK